MKNTEILLRTYACTGCGRCVEACRRGVLRLVDNGAGRVVEVADAESCAACRACEHRCPAGAIAIRKIEGCKSRPRPNAENPEKQRTMNRHLKFVLHFVGGIVLLAAAVGAAMWLWNALIPDIFGWSRVGYWQMLGLLALAHLFFGHLHGSVSMRRHHRHLHKGMRGMSREERREFIRRRMKTLGDDENPTDDAGKAE